MTGQVLYDLFIVLAWVGIWGFFEGIIDKIAKDDPNIRFIIYVLISLVAIFAVWIIDKNT